MDQITAFGHCMEQALAGRSQGLDCPNCLAPRKKAQEICAADFTG
jgi:hypothetical protein